MELDRDHAFEFKMDDEPAHWIAQQPTIIPADKEKENVE